MKIGILGGGQLSQMLALSGIKLGMSFHFYVPNNLTEALNGLGKIHFGEYTDFDKLTLFSNEVDVITYENENIPVSTLEFLEKINHVYPDKKALCVSQDRFLEKNIFHSLNIPTNNYIKIDNKQELLAAAYQLGYPFILKKRTQGYDGKGQIKIKDISDIEILNNEDCSNTIAEEFVQFDREISIIGARNINGNTVFYDVCENLHKNGILIKTINKSQDDSFELARHYLESIMLKLDYVGVLTLELFQKQNELIANEMAPRVHNSGHWTIEACVASQFENHLRSILNLPLGNTSSFGSFCMYNILSKMPSLNALLDFDALSLHDYQKTPKIGRKLGHVTFLHNQEKMQKKFFYLEELLINSM